MDRHASGQLWSPAAGATVAQDPLQRPRVQKKRKGFAVYKVKRAQKDSSPSASSFPGSRGASTRDGHRASFEFVQDLALPLGMSLAAVLSQILGSKLDSRDQTPAEHLSMVCTSAVKESVSNIYGNKFDCFISLFEKSFDSTLKTLQIINQTSISSQKHRLREENPLDGEENRSIYDSFHDKEGSTSFSSSPTIIPSSLVPFNGSRKHFVRGKMNQQLVNPSHNTISPGFSDCFLTTFEKSVTEQMRSNNLKAVEIGLNMRKMEMKKSQLALNFHANLIEKVKICMNISKAAFKEEKLRNQIRDARHVELVRRFLDLLVCGLMLMCGFLVYGASIFSYQRIKDATSSCTNISSESKSWWKPKQITTFNSSWQMLRCQTVAITRMLFGLFILLAVTFLLVHRSIAAAPATPVTFILALLGIVCGIAGKLCVDTLGGSGLHWLIYWEALCFVHLFANVFPSIIYRFFYGRVSVSNGEKGVGVPYWIRRWLLYGVLLVAPVMAGLLPFASLFDWKEHFAGKLRVLTSGSSHEA